MRKLFLSCIYLLIGLFVYLFIPLDTVRASGEFQADYDVKYAIAPSGNTIVTQNITLTNKQTNLYPQKYSIILDTTKIKNVIAYDSREIVQTDISQADGKTTILLTFNDKVVGLGKQLSFTLRFENGEIAQRNGTIWEVNIPGIAPDADIASYNVSLSVPQTFGPNAYMSPLPIGGSRWTKDQMTSGGISAAYGTSQSFDVHLTYFIQNTGITPARAEIALPPDTAYQTVVITSITPKTDGVVRSREGNWLAYYTLAPGGSQSVEVTLHIDVTMHPKETYTDEAAELSAYTKEQKYWETSNQKIADLAKTYTTPRAIYTYVVSALNYDYTRVKDQPIRKGAVAALASPDNSICMEFTDLFIAIARAAGIPAREAVGYAYTTNSRLRPLSLVSDVLHSWPEYYDRERKIWVAIDPTWANTTGGVNYFDKLDYNHIVFALHGEGSEYPYPAGFYRKSNKTTKDVTVEFSSQPFTIPEGKLKSTLEFPELITAGITARGFVRIENTVGVSIPNADIIIQSAPIDVAILKKEQHVPPFGRIEIPVAMTAPNYLTASAGKFAVTVNGQSSVYPIRIQPITAYFIVPILSFGAILLILLFIIVHRLHLWKRRKKH